MYGFGCDNCERTALGQVDPASVAALCADPIAVADLERQLAGVESYITYWRGQVAAGVPDSQASLDYWIAVATQITEVLSVCGVATSRCEPEAVAQMQAAYTAIVQAIPKLDADAAMGLPGAAATLDAALAEIANIEDRLAYCGATVPVVRPLPPSVPSGNEIYIINGIRIEVVAGTGPNRATELVEAGCVGPEVVSCASTTSEPEPLPEGESVPTISPGTNGRQVLMAGVGLLALLFIGRPRKR